MQCIKEYKLNHVICISERRFQVSILPIWLFYPMLIPSNMNGKPIKSDQIHLQTLSYMYPNTFESSETYRMLRMDISQFYLWFGASNFPLKKRKQFLKTQKFHKILHSNFSLQYSIDNYEERRKYELQAERIREEMQARLGSSTNEMDSQNERLNALRRVESQINELKRMEGQTHSGAEPRGAGGRIIQQPRSADLAQLYHEAIPMDKALSHSGPSAFGNGQGGLLQQHPVSLQIFLHYRVAQQVLDLT